MAAEGRTADSRIDDRLFETARQVSFFQAVHLLERYFQPPARVGHQGPVSQEIIRFRPEASLAFPSSDVSSIERLPEEGRDKPRFRVTTTFLGLYGATTPLPAFYTEEILWKEREDDPVRAFLDIFHHRLISLFYRIWTKYRYYIQFEPEGSDEFSRRMLGLVGLGTQGLADSAGIPAVRAVRYAGLLTQQPRSASALEGVLCDFFEGIPVEVEQFSGRWVPIKSDQRSALGRRRCRLGTDCVVGSRVYGRSSSFRVRVGPMGLNVFLGFLPGAENFEALSALTRLFVQDRLQFDVELLIQTEELPRLQLKSDGQLRLGWTTWLSSGASDGEFTRSLLLSASSLKRAAVSEAEPLAVGH